MSDRLDELKRQRALVAGHLQWLDREIASLEATVPSPSPQVPATPAPPPRLTAGLPPPSPSDIDAAMAHMQEEERRKGEISKSGCWLVFAGLLLIGVGGLATFIFLRYR